jgi:sensor histidine kinase YesM
MEQLTKQIKDDTISTRRMWRNYALGWIVYMLVLTMAQQVDNLGLHRFDWHILTLTISLVAPQALILALHWPLSGWFERKRVSLPLICLVHVTGALAFTALCYGPVMMTVPNRTMAYHIWPLMYFVMGYGVVATMFYMVRANAARQRQAAAIQQAHSLLIATELNALRNKLNPHFLFNTLHSIIALTRKDPDAAETALFQFSDMLRYVLDAEKNGDRVTLEDELTFVRDYLELESLRLGERLHIAWELDDDAGRHALPALSLQPLVENSIKHAFNPHSRPGHLLIRTRVDEAAGKLAMTVGDDGPGADLGQVRASNGLGIRTVERRLQLEYGAAGALAIETAPGAGFTVTMSVPLAAH